MSEAEAIVKNNSVRLKLSEEIMEADLMILFCIKGKAANIYNTIFKFRDPKKPLTDKEREIICDFIFRLFQDDSSFNGIDSVLSKSVEAKAEKRRILSMLK